MIMREVSRVGDTVGDMGGTLCRNKSENLDKLA